MQQPPSEPNHRPADTILEIESVSKAFVVNKRRVQALDGVGFHLPRGRITGLIGPDGAGKTTLLRLVVGLLAPDAGRIRMPDAQSSVGYMPQRFGLYEDLTVQENLDLYADLQAVPVKARKARYDELMQMTNLGRFTGRMAGALSGGMKQKLGLACTLIRPPRLLLLDEPTVGVDPVSRRELWSIVYRLVQSEGLTVMLSTAYLDEAERCHRVVLMHRGKLLGEGAPGDFSERVRGRSFQVRVPGLNKRAVQTRLNQAEGVVDAIIQGGGVRVVMQEKAAPDLERLLPDLAGGREGRQAQVDPVAPRFEDSFVDRLRAAEGGPAYTRAAVSGPAGRQAAGAEVIQVTDVKRRFGDFYAVRGIDFSVRRGEVFGLLGANGAGKSTTFRMLCGLLPPSEGSLLVSGRDLRHAAASARSRIGYMAQHFSLYGDLSVKENLKFFSSAYGLSGKMQRERIDWAMEEFELADYAKTTSKDLPLGYKQRLALAAALMHSPDILFLDEPTSGVDPLARREFWHRISRLAEQGVTVLVTTHFMEEAEYCDRLVMMAEGEILVEGAPEEMKARFRSEQTPEPSMEDVFIGWMKIQEGAEA